MPRESKQARLSRMHQEYAVLCEEIPHPKCALNFSNPFELLVATVLSAQTTDKRVNMVTPELFGEYPGPAALASANPEHVESIIHSHRISSYEGKEHHRTFLRIVRTVRRRGAANHGCFDKSARGRAQNRERGAWQCFWRAGIPCRHACDPCDRATALAFGLGERLPRPQSHRTRDHRLLPARRVDGPVSQADIAWSCHMPCAQARLPQLPP